MRILFNANRGVFLDKGLDLVIAKSLGQAIEYLAKFKIMAVLLDLKLPGESEGAETVKIIKEKTDAPIFGFSGAVDSALKDLCVEYGAHDLFLKGMIELPSLAGILKTAASNYRNSLEIKEGFNAILGQ
jgi:DNA-binding response OmpR family regulator